MLFVREHISILILSWTARQCQILEIEMKVCSTNLQVKHRVESPPRIFWEMKCSDQFIHGFCRLFKSPDSRENVGLSNFQIVGWGVSIARVCTVWPWFPMLSLEFSLKYQSLAWCLSRLESLFSWLNLFPNHKRDQIEGIDFWETNPFLSICSASDNPRGLLTYNHQI